VQVVQAWIDALTSGDAEGAASLLAEEGFLIFEAGDTILSYEGRGTASDVLTGLLNDIEVTGLREEPELIEGTVVWRETWLTTDETGDPLEVIVGGEALVQAGEIVSLIYTPSEEGVIGVPTGMPKSGAGSATWLLWLGALGGMVAMVGSGLKRAGRAPAPIRIRRRIDDE
jgi:hypothetical protein